MFDIGNVIRQMRDLYRDYAFSVNAYNFVVVNDIKPLYL